MDMNFGMIPTIQFRNQLYSQQLPRVNGSSEAKNYPSSFNSEIVLLDSNDSSLMYIKATDMNGAVRVSRYRYYEDPEPTQQEINDSRYLTKEDFNRQIAELKQELLNSTKQGRGKFYNGNRSNDSTKEDV